MARHSLSRTLWRLSMSVQSFRSFRITTFRMQPLKFSLSSNVPLGAVSVGVGRMEGFSMVNVRIPADVTHPAILRCIEALLWPPFVAHRSTAQAACWSDSCPHAALFGDLRTGRTRYATGCRRGCISTEEYSERVLDSRLRRRLKGQPVT